MVSKAFDRTEAFDGAPGLPEAGSVLAVVAHPDDESFGMGAVLASMHATGATTSVLCFTRGGASTLGLSSLNGSALHTVRSAELAAAAQVLGVTEVRLLDYPDGRLAATPAEELSELVASIARTQHTDLLLVFDDGGITGHPDHVHATRAALAAAERLDLAVLAWALAEDVAADLNAEFGTSFVGRSEGDLDYCIDVDRTAQLAAISCHRTQSAANPVLWRRLELTGEQEHLRVLRRRRNRPTPGRHWTSTP